MSREERRIAHSSPGEHVLTPSASARNAPILGVTGPVAAGKSALSSRLADLGARVVDVDGLGRRALEDPAVRGAVVRAFGRDVLADDGSLDRRALAARVFVDEASRRRLELIVHPVVRERIDAEIEDAREAGAPLVVLDCALLFESGLDALCDETVDVDAPEAARIVRALAAHGWDAEETRRRGAAQLAPDEKRARAGRVIVNDADETRLAHEARSLFDAARRRRRARAPARRET